MQPRSAVSPCLYVMREFLARLILASGATALGSVMNLYLAHQLAE
ncbi:MAG: hypothetical protein AABN95_24715 [Acidobacteriota bacterium]